MRLHATGRRLPSCNHHTRLQLLRLRNGWAAEKARLRSDRTTIPPGRLGITTIGIDPSGSKIIFAIVDKLTATKAAQTGCIAGVVATFIFGSVQTSGSDMPDTRTPAIVVLFFLVGGIASSLLLAKFGAKKRAFGGFVWLVVITVLLWFGSSPTVIR